MGREILFRAKSADSGEWVEGSFIHVFQEEKKSAICGKDRDVYFIAEMSGKMHTVIPETVCQYTGLTDKKGRKVFEGDVICNRYDELFPEDRTMQVIVWDDFRWGIKNDGVIDEFDDFNCKNGEITGNIFDNPELLKGVEEQMEQMEVQEALQCLKFIEKAYENLAKNGTGMGRLVGEGVDCPVKIKTYGELYRYHAESVRIAVSALKEVEQYQELGSIQFIKDTLFKYEQLKCSRCMFEEINAREIKEYRELGTVQELKDLKESNLTGLELAKTAAAVQKLKKYEEIGTVKECREARGKQVPRRPTEDTAFGLCPCCHTELNSEMENEYGIKYCPYCGQAIDLREKE